MFKKLLTRLICRIYGIKNYTIDKDYNIEVNGNVDISGKSLKRIPLNFTKVTGNFECYSNQLTSLEGCPKFVGGNFNCSSNRLTTLKYCPEFIGNDFLFYLNRIHSFEFCPRTIYGNLDCSFNNISNFNFLPKIGNKFLCGYDFSLLMRNHNPIYEIYRLFDNKDCTYSISDFKVIKSDNKIIYWVRLKEVFLELDIPAPNPEDLKFDFYQLKY